MQLFFQMQLSFHGAARTVTGSKHLLHLDNGKKILFDCGMFQGMGLETIELNQRFGFRPKDVDYVLLSHAHIDHIGLLPRLVSEGFNGKVFCTAATAALAEVMLQDSAYIQESDVRHINKRRKRQGRPFVKALYNQSDAEKVFPLLKKTGYNSWHKIEENIHVMFREAGHILGSSTVHLKIKTKTGNKVISFSGDIGRYNDDLLKSPDVFPQSDVIIMESTYGDKLHPPFKPSIDLLFSAIETTCVKQKGKLIIPAFSVGRTQELLYALNQLELMGKLPKISYYLDSPMSIEITKITKQFPHLFNKEVQEVLKVDQDPFDFNGFKTINSVQESKALNGMKEPCVIISASGMAEAGRVKHHIANNIGDKNNSVLLVGYAEPQSLAGRLKAGNQEVGIFGTKYEVNASIFSIKSLSAHGDYPDLIKWLSCQDKDQIKHIFLVHGEYAVQKNFKNKLEEMGFNHINIPELHSTFEI